MPTTNSIKELQEPLQMLIQCSSLPFQQGLDDSCHRIRRNRSPASAAKARCGQPRRPCKIGRLGWNPSGMQRYSIDAQCENPRISNLTCQRAARLPGRYWHLLSASSPQHCDGGKRQSLAWPVFERPAIAHAQCCHFPFPKWWSWHSLWCSRAWRLPAWPWSRPSRARTCSLQLSNPSHNNQQSINKPNLKTKFVGTGTVIWRTWKLGPCPPTMKKTQFQKAS